MKRLTLFLLGLVFVLGGCATTQDSDDRRINPIPWNRPESYENSGPLGFLNTR